MFTEPAKGASGLFCVDWALNFVHWLAWREWQHEEFGKQFFPQKLTVAFAWPPTSGQGATVCADMLRQAREEIAKDDRKNGGGSCAAVPDIVSPWREWSPAVKRGLAETESARRRDSSAPSFSHAPRYPWRVSHSVFQAPEVVHGKYSERVQ